MVKTDIIGWLLAAVLLIALIASNAFRGDDMGEDAARDAEERIEALETELDSVSSMRDSLATQDSILKQELADSVQVWEQRQQASLIRETMVRRRASEVATEVMAQADSVTRVRFEEYEALRDSIDLEKDAQLATSAQEVAALRVRVGVLEQERDALRDEIRLAAAIETQRVVQVDGLEKALRSKKRQAWFERAGLVAVVAVVVLR